MPIYLSNVTTSTISVALTGLTDLTMSGRTLQWTLNGQTKQTISIPSNVASSDSRVCPYTFRGLASSTTYKIDGIITLPSGWTGSAGAIDVTTEETAIPSWSWSASNGAASATQTKNAYAVLRGTREASDFSYKVWNDLVDKTLEMRLEVKGSWDTAGGKYPTAAGCRVSAGETLSAEKYNGVRYNIGSVEPTDILDVSRGERLTGYHIIRLTDVLNDIIDGL